MTTDLPSSVDRICHNPLVLMPNTRVRICVLGSGSISPVESLSVRTGSEPVYNIEVADLHTYAVGFDGVAVHNKAASNPFMPPVRMAGSPRLAASGEDLFVGTYSRSYRANVNAGVNGDFTPHHSLQDAVSLTTHGRGITINLSQDLHALTRTFRQPVEQGLTLTQHLGRDVWDLRAILKNAGYDPKVINAQLQELIRQNRAIPGFPQ